MENHPARSGDLKRYWAMVARSVGRRSLLRRSSADGRFRVNVCGSHALHFDARGEPLDSSVILLRAKVCCGGELAQASGNRNIAAIDGCCVLR